jgi:hypothetical protein
MVPVLLLVLFPILYIFDTRLAIGALLMAIVLLYVSRTNRATRAARTKADERPMTAWKDPWGT